ncbi:MAG: RHS repeat-associated core domain-containing protein [Planctomycetes bacterium]|nr:RHS repeat-associated core domain-containing protein [Planctomycetota bacterium]
MDRVAHPTPSHTHELVTAGGQSVTHDTKGNMLLIPASVRANSSPLVLTWDFDNRMVSADVGADSVIDVTHQYDALGRRVARKASGSTTVFVQVDQQTICDYASGAAPASSTYRYLYGSYIDEPIVRIATSNSETTWYHRNQQYSIVACTDSSGAATERYAYTAYGLPTITDGSGTVRTSSANGNRYTFTGREWDGVLGLYHYRARMYEATIGRFCSRDPIGYGAGQLNIYEFVRSQPSTHLAPSGLVCCDCKDGERKLIVGQIAQPSYEFGNVYDTNNTVGYTETIYYALRTSWEKIATWNGPKRCGNYMHAQLSLYVVHPHRTYEFGAEVGLDFPRGGIAISFSSEYHPAAATPIPVVDAKPQQDPCYMYEAELYAEMVETGFYHNRIPRDPFDSSIDNVFVAQDYDIIPTLGTPPKWYTEKWEILFYATCCSGNK